VNPARTVPVVADSDTATEAPDESELEASAEDFAKVEVVVSPLEHP